MTEQIEYTLTLSLPGRGRLNVNRHILCEDLQGALPRVARELGGFVAALSDCPGMQIVIHPPNMPANIQLSMPEQAVEALAASSQIAREALPPPKQPKPRSRHRLAATRVSPRSRRGKHRTEAPPQAAAPPKRKETMRPRKIGVEGKRAFGRWLAAARTERGWIPADVAIRLNVGPYTVVTWERGQFAPMGATLEKLGKLFQMPAEQLLELLEGDGTATHPGSPSTSSAFSGHPEPFATLAPRPACVEAGSPRGDVGGCAEGPNSAPAVTSGIGDDFFRRDPRGGGDPSHVREMQRPDAV